MDSGARQLLSLLSFLPEGIAWQDIDSIMPGAGPPSATVLRKTGLAFDESGRLRVLAPLREHVARCHPPLRGSLLPMVEHYCGLAAKHGLFVGTAEGHEAVARLTLEYTNIASAVLLGLETAMEPRSIEAAIGLAAFMRLVGVGHSDLLRKTAASAQRCGDIRGQARCIHEQARIAIRRSDHATAVACYEQAHRLYEQLGNVQGQANCIFGHGQILLRRSEYATAHVRFEEACPLYERVDDVQGQAHCIWSLAEIASRRSEYATAVRQPGTLGGALGGSVFPARPRAAQHGTVARGS